MSLRLDGRHDLEIRPFKIHPKFYGYALSSVLIEMGRTVVACSVSVQHGVPKFLKGSQSGWLTAEYQMLPSSTQERSARDHTRSAPNGRSLEIQRLIGRVLRQCVDLSALGEHTITVDCDVLQADGGTRIAAINGGSVALAIALEKMYLQKKTSSRLFKGLIGGISCGYVQGRLLMDLCYEEDSQADVDGFVLVNDKKKIIGTDLSVENESLSFEQWQDISLKGYHEAQHIVSLQQSFVESFLSVTS